MRIPPIAWAGIVAIVVLALAITAGLLTGPGNPSPGCSPSTSASTTPSACATATP
jgi:hypothetical protein